MNASTLPRAAALRDLVNAEQADAVGYLLLHEEHKGCLPAVAAVPDRYRAAVASLTADGFLTETTGVHLTPEGVNLLAAVDAAQWSARGPLTLACPEGDGEQWVERSRLADGADPTVVVTLACGHVVL